MSKIKAIKPLKGMKNSMPAHGDSYGSGIKNKEGRAISIMGVKPTKKMNKPPKSLA